MTGLLAVSDDVILGVVTAVLAFLGTALTAVMTYLMAKLNKKQDEAAVKVSAVAEKAEEVKTELVKSTAAFGVKLDDIAKVGEMTHNLCNSAMLEQKRLLAVTSRSKADATKAQIDITAAEHAERMYDDHKAKQAAMDVRSEEREKRKDGES